MRVIWIFYSQYQINNNEIIIYSFRALKYNSNLNLAHHQNGISPTEIYVEAIQRMHISRYTSKCIHQDKQSPYHRKEICRYARPHSDDTPSYASGIRHTCDKKKPCKREAAAEKQNRIIIIEDDFRLYKWKKLLLQLTTATAAAKSSSNHRHGLDVNKFS